MFDDEVIYLDGFGVRETGKPETVDADTVFQLASLSKDAVTFETRPDQTARSVTLGDLAGVGFETFQRVGE